MRLPAVISGWFGRQAALAVALLMGIGMLFMLVLMFDIARQENQRSTQTARALVEVAFKQQRSRLEAMVKDYAAWGDAYRHLNGTVDTDWAFTRQNLGPTLFKELGLEFVFVVSPDRGTTYALLRGNLSGSAAAETFGGRFDKLIERARALGSDTSVPVSDVLMAWDTPVLVGAAVLSPGQDPTVPAIEGPPAVLLFGEALTPARLDEIGRANFITGLRATPSNGPQAAGEAVLPVATQSGPPLIDLLWKPDQPGNRLISQMFPWIGMLLVALVVLTIVILVHGHRTAWRLKETSTRLSDARSRSQYLLLHDVATGLPNHTLLAQMLGKSLTAREADNVDIAVLHLTLGRLASIHNTLGREASNQVIGEVARRLRAKARDYDIVGRGLGDDFVVVMSGMLDRDEIERICRRFIEVLEAPITTHVGDIHTTIAIGVSVAPDDACEAETLLRRSRLAMNEAMREGGDAVSFFRPSMELQAEAKQLLDAELRDALAAGEFTLAFQPRFAAATQRLVGVEALVRWPHRRLGLVSPVDFIPLAEETGLIVPLGEWVLRNACRVAAPWPELAVSVNLSPVQFRRPDLAATVRAVLTETGLEPERLELELTESTLLGNTDLSLALMGQITALGVKLAIDDFGTGYSALGYLRTFPFERIKIDRSFVTDLAQSGQARSIIQAIVGLGHALGMSVTAEGVETGEQLAILQADGCDEVQGFYLAMPMPENELTLLLQALRV